MTTTPSHELPDLDRLLDRAERIADWLENASMRRSAADVRSLIAAARRAQPEGEAPQAVIADAPTAVSRVKELMSAQHAESGAPSHETIVREGSNLVCTACGTSAPGTPEAPQTAAACDVLAERQRQVEVEGWESSADDRYSEGELVMAAVCYAMNGDDAASPVPYAWPWDKKWWKPGSDRRNLVKAGALILADIERLDRAAQLDGGQGESV